LIKSTGNILLGAARGLAVPRVLQKLQAYGVVNPASAKHYGLVKSQKPNIRAS
jgi:hypothetical protein